MDAIREAMISTNKGFILRETNREYRMKWLHLILERKVKAARKEAWHPAIREAKKIFRARLSHWSSLSVSFIGDGFCVDWSTRKCRGYIHYQAWWKGLQVDRSFTARSMEDVIREAGKLDCLLKGWVPS